MKSNQILMAGALALSMILSGCSATSTSEDVKDAKATETATKADSKKALEAFVATIGESLKKDEKVALVGFGSFSVSERSARAGRNPQTGKTIQIPAKKVVRFKAGAELEGQL